MCHNVNAPSANSSYGLIRFNLHRLTLNINLCYLNIPIRSHHSISHHPHLRFITTCFRHHPRSVGEIFQPNLVSPWHHPLDLALPFYNFLLPSRLSLFKQCTRNSGQCLQALVMFSPCCTDTAGYPLIRRRIRRYRYGHADTALFACDTAKQCIDTANV